MKLLAAWIAAAALATAGGAAKDFVEWNNQAGKLFAQARYQEAETLYRRALEAARDTGPEAARDRAITRANLGTLLRLRGAYREAAPLLEEAVRELRDLAGAGVVDLGRSLGNLAGVYHALGHFPLAETAVRESIALFAAHPEIPGREKQNQELILAAICIDTHRFEEAQSFLEPVSRNAAAPLASTAFSSLAAVAIQAGSIEQAEKYAAEAVQQARKAYPPNHPAIAAALNNLAQAYRFGSRFLEAERHYREAIEIWQTALGPAHPDLARGLMNLAALYHDRGREAGAEELYQRAAGIFAASLGSEHPQTLAVRNELAEVWRAQRRFSESERLGRFTLATLERVVGEDDPRLARALANRVRLLTEIRRPTEAAALAQRVREQR